MLGLLDQTVGYDAVPAPDLGDATWVKSDRSNSSGNCARFAQLPGGLVALSNSTDPDGPAHLLDLDMAAQFVRALKDGDHDELL